MNKCRVQIYLNPEIYALLQQEVARGLFNSEGDAARFYLTQALLTDVADKPPVEVKAKIPKPPITEVNTPIDSVEVPNAKSSLSKLRRKLNNP